MFDFFDTNSHNHTHSLEAQFTVTRNGSFYIRCMCITSQSDATVCDVHAWHLSLNCIQPSEVGHRASIFALFFLKLQLHVLLPVVVVVIRVGRTTFCFYLHPREIFCTFFFSFVQRKKKKTKKEIETETPFEKNVNNHYDEPVSSVVALGEKFLFTFHSDLRREGLWKLNWERPEKATFSLLLEFKYS